MREATATDATEATQRTDARRLEDAQAAFERGDHATVRRLCAQLRRAPEAEVRQEAEALRQRVSMDPAQGVVLAACLALFAVIVYLYLVP